MKSDYEILGLDDNATFEVVKKKYYKLMKKYPPESCGEQFIIINRAYENIKNSLMEKENYLLKNIISIVFSGGRNQRDFYNYINEYIKSINKENFKVKNDEIVDLTVYLKENGYLSEALFLAFCAKKRYESLALNRLAETYVKFEEFIVNNKTPIR